MDTLASVVGLVSGAWKRPPVLIVLLLNLIPVACVIWLDWSVLMLLAVYWLENVVIGLFNVLRMAADAWGKPAAEAWSAAFAIPFFIIHYGGFCAGHGLFVLLLGGGAFQGGDPFSTAPAILAANRDSLLWTAGALAGSHLAGFIAWLRRGDWRRTTPMEQMGAPYGRIIVLHLALLFGAFLLAWLHNPAWGVALLGVLKTIYETASTTRRIEKREAARAA